MIRAQLNGSNVARIPINDLPGEERKRTESLQFCEKKELNEISDYAAINYRFKHPYLCVYVRGTKEETDRTKHSEKYDYDEFFNYVRPDRE